MKEWTITVKIAAYDLKSLQAAFDTAAKQVAAAKIPSQLSMSWASSSGFGEGQNHVRCHSEYSCPDEDRIKALRDEADRLETKLRSNG